MGDSARDSDDKIRSGALGASPLGCKARNEAGGTLWVFGALAGQLWLCVSTMQAPSISFIVVTIVLIFIALALSHH